ncbi:hypothetical protein ACHAXT_004548 [Thalassiosira profunda]
MSEALCALGIVGLTPLGQKLAAHHASEGTRVCVADEDPSFVPQVVDEYRSQMQPGDDGGGDDRDKVGWGCMLPSGNMEELVARLEAPRKIVVCGTHGDDAKFEEAWAKLGPHLEGCDTVLRWGREEGGTGPVHFYNDSVVGTISQQQAQPKGVFLLEMVRLGRDRTAAFDSDEPGSFMVGGPEEAYEQMRPFVAPFATAGRVGNDARCAHYAHMILQTIENGALQAFAEGSDVLARIAGHERPDVGRTLKYWNDRMERMAGYLARSLSKVHYKRDEMGASDTWATLEAARLGMPAPTVNAALQAKLLSVMKEERVAAASVLKGAPEFKDTPSVMKDQIAGDLQNAIYGACMVVCAECFGIFLAASEAESWDANIEECLKLWNRPGTLLESTFLERIQSSLEGKPDELKSLLVLPGIASELQELHMSWRRVVTLSFASAVPCPTLSAALTYHDSYRSHRLPTAIIQAQRDFFDEAGYDRVDQEGRFSSRWTKDHTRINKKKQMEQKPRKRKRKST